MPQLIQPLESILNSNLTLQLSYRTHLISGALPEALAVARTSAGKFTPATAYLEDHHLLFLICPANVGEILTMRYRPSLERQHHIIDAGMLEDSGAFYKLSDGTAVVIYRTAREFKNMHASKVASVDYRGRAEELGIET